MANSVAAPSRTRRAWLAMTLAAAMVAAACSGTPTDLGEPGALEPSERPDPSWQATVDARPLVGAPPGEPFTEPGFDYVWQRLPLGAGGWVTGLVIHAESGAKYARTDVGGAYRYDDATQTWHQMLLASAVPDPDPTSKEYAVEAIAVSPADPDVVVIVVGGDENPAEGEPVAGTGRVLRSADGGRTWVAATNRFFVNGNHTHRWLGERLAFDPTTPDRLLLGTRREGLWESTDGGATFTQVSTDQVPIGVPNSPEQHHAGITFVTFDPATPTRVYAGVAGTGVYRSDDAGHTWREAFPVEPRVQVPFEGIVADGRLLVAVNTIDGDAPGLLRWYDPGSERVTDIAPSGASAWAAAVDPTDPDHLVVADLAVRTGHFWHSRDGGRTYRQLDVAIDAATIPWLDATDLAGWMSIGRLVFDPLEPGRLWFAEGMGMWRTDDLRAGANPDGVTWVLDSRGIEELVIADVVSVPSRSPFVVVADRQGFRVRDLDAYPSRPLVDRRFAGGTDLDYSGTDPDALVWIGAEYHIYWDANRRARAAISRDGGATWTELPNLRKEMFGGNVAISATDPDNIVWLPSYYINPFEYHDRGKGLYVTKDAGESWSRLTIDNKHNFHRLMWWLSRQALTADKVDGGVFYLQNDTAEFYVSTNGGTSWRKALHSAPCAEHNACHVFGQIFASPGTAEEVWSSVGEGGLYRTRDRGATEWEQLPGIEDVRVYGFGAPLTDGGPYAVYAYGKANGDPELGFWRSGDDGRTWQRFGTIAYDTYSEVVALTGDLDVLGRVWVGFGGSGVVYGDDPTLTR